MTIDAGIGVARRREDDHITPMRVETVAGMPDGFVTRVWYAERYSVLAQHETRSIGEACIVSEEMVAMTNRGANRRRVRMPRFDPDARGRQVVREGRTPHQQKHQCSAQQ